MIKKIFNRTGSILTAAIILVVGVGVAWGMQSGAKQLPIRQYFPGGYTNAVWDWSNPATRDQQNLDALTDFMYLHQFNASYLDIGSYVSIASNTDPVKAAADKQKLEDAISRYVMALSKHDIAVYAAAGDTTWSNPDQRHIPLSILSFVNEYNRKYPSAKLAGVQFDIESYNQDGFSAGSETSKALVLGDYLDTVDELATQTAAYQKNGQDISLGFAIPYWYDNENGNIPMVTWKDKTGPTLYHILDRLNTLPKSNVVVMAYRNAAGGNDGVIAHSRTEIDYAQAKAPKVRVVIGQEVNEVDPAKITYFGKSLTELSIQVKAFEDEFKQSGVLGGVAINDLKGYQAMRDN